MKNFFLSLLILLSLYLPAQTSVRFRSPVIRLTKSIPCTEVKDQGNSSTCWAFGTNSLFESDILKKQQARINLSEMFIARYAYIDKALKFLETEGKTYFKGGGQFQDVLRVVNKYGMVTEEAYSGLLKGSVDHNHEKLDTAISRFIRLVLQQGKTFLNTGELQQLNDTLDRYLGKIPETFWSETKTYSPQSFAQEFISPDDYVQLMSFSNLPLYKKCLLDDKFNWAGDSLYNITLSDMQMIIDSAMAGGWSVGWEGDVTEPGFDFLTGFATAGSTSLQMDEQRLRDFKEQSTERDHMLHLVGIGRDEHNKKWYYLKNSWGTWFSHFDGFLYMDENYFKLKTVVLMVNKSALPENLKHTLGIK